MFDLIAFTIIRTFIAKDALRISLADRPPVTLSGPAPGPQASIHVHDRRTLWRLVMIPDLAFGEAYMDGRLTVPVDGLDSLVDTFLDPWRQYSYAYFHDPDESLDTEQVNKLARLAAKLDLKAGDNILDMGCGWGGLGMAMAACGRNTKVTGITLPRH
ncbi:MAG: hypothetical protein CMN39_06640 [SAR116 cluster bacterium]|nr:hypothetical protein [SAR116 cluster bacterium]